MNAELRKTIDDFNKAAGRFGRKQRRKEVKVFEVPLPKLNWLGWQEVEIIEEAR